MEAGFARACITPPVGTRMMGFTDRDTDHGCEGVHDDLFVRALYLAHGEEKALIMGFDLCFLGRQDVDRFKGAIGRRLDLSPRQILMNTSHIHVGPAVGTWGYALFEEPPDALYLQRLEQATVGVACEAVDAAREVTVWAGAARTALPMSRRRPDGKGGVLWAPHPEGTVCDCLPVCLLKDASGRAVSLLFSVSCHPSTIGGFLISAEYPGVAMDRLDAHLGGTCSLFLQGAGGDAKPSVVGKGKDYWPRGTWEDVARAGQMVAGEVIALLEGGLVQVEPQLRAATTETHWPLAPHPGRAAYEALLADPSTDRLRRLWAERQIAMLERGMELPTSVPVTVHGIQLGRGLRLVGLEGEAVAALGLLILDYYRQGVTFPLGYTDGAQLYLIASPMVDEGGYEAESYYEYGFPAPLQKGMEKVLLEALEELRSGGIA